MKLPMICDFRKPIIRGQYKVTTTKPFCMSRDPEKINFVRENGTAISLRNLFLKDWNDGKVDINPGDHIHVPTEKNLYISFDNNELLPIVITFDVKVESRLYFGYVGIEKSQGIVNAIDGTYATKELITEPVNYVDVETKWKRINSVEEAPQAPFMTIVAQDIFPTEKER